VAQATQRPLCIEKSKWITKIADDNERYAAMLFIWSEITLEQCEMWLERGIDPCITLYLERPRQIFTMASGLLCVHGKNLAVTRWGFADFRWADDAARAAISGYYNLCSSVDIINAKLRVLLEDIVCINRIGGDGVSFVTSKNGLLGDVGGSKQDMIVRWVPTHIPNGRPRTIYDIGGAWNTAVRARLSDIVSFTAPTKPLVPSALFYNQWLRLHEINRNVRVYDRRFRSEQIVHNTVVMQGGQYFYNSRTGGWDIMVESQDSFGREVRPGINKERCFDLGEPTAIRATTGVCPDVF
jgi:hypothetical protein